MKLKELIESEHSKRQTDTIIRYVGTNKKRLDELMSLFLGKDFKISQRAGWPLSYIGQYHPELFPKYIPKLLSNLERKDIHEAVLRNTIRFFSEMEIPEKHCGTIYDLCLNYSKSTLIPFAVRVYAMYTVAKICKRYPELRPEFEIVLNELNNYPQPPSIRAGIKNSSKILLKK